MERRRGDKAELKPMDVLRALPALVVLERFPVPVLATAEDGAILFANGAFAEMLGYTADEVLSLQFHQIFHAMPADESAREGRASARRSDRRTGGTGRFDQARTNEQVGAGAG